VIVLSWIIVSEQLQYARWSPEDNMLVINCTSFLKICKNTFASYELHQIPSPCRICVCFDLEHCGFEGIRWLTLEYIDTLVQTRPHYGAVFSVYGIICIVYGVTTYDHNTVPTKRVSCNLYTLVIIPFESLTSK
jgi:hypothetical protein